MTVKVLNHGGGDKKNNNNILLINSIIKANVYLFFPCIFKKSHFTFHLASQTKCVIIMMKMTETTPSLFLDNLKNLAFFKFSFYSNVKCYHTVSK